MIGGGGSSGGASTPALRTALIWHDEVMDDLVLDKPRKITLGHTGNTTFTVPELGLPPKFAIVRPGNRGYLLTLGERMRGTICVGGREKDVAELVRAEGAAGGFCATPISNRDWGVIELDDSGAYKLFFQFVPVDEPPQFFTRQMMVAGAAGYVLSSLALVLLWYVKGVATDEALFRGIGLSTLAMIIGSVVWSMIRSEGESQASLAFSVVLHAALLFMTYQLYEGENPFVWPGPRALTGNYLVTRLDKEEPPEPPTPVVAEKKPQAAASAAATKAPPKKTATKGDEGKAGGKGDTERARDPNAKDVPPDPPKVQFFEDKNRKILDNIIDRNLSTSLSKFTGIKGDTLTKGSLGFGPGQGTGVGAGVGTGTRTGSKKGGRGGGGNVEGDFVTGPGKIDTGKERPGGGNCVGTSCGTGPKSIKVGFAAPAGDFGGLTAEEIDRVVKARAGVFRACYQKELNHTPGIGGKLIIHFKIGGDGTVQAGNTSTAGGSSLRNDAVEQCVKSNVNRLKFPAKGGIANVNYPFVFTQGG
ncbi:MAG: AgmX/PglI C-terminal domain-containing protein [Myxococcales bacterium]|nr:AgmX/PglI C-terminal domain-containing protein [Myxococcales bacterium]